MLDILKFLSSHNDFNDIIFQHFTSPFVLQHLFRTPLFERLLSIQKVQVRVRELIPPTTCELDHLPSGDPVPFLLESLERLDEEHFNRLFVSLFRRDPGLYSDMRDCRRIVQDEIDRDAA